MIRSTWFLALLGVLLGTATTTTVVLMNKDLIISGPQRELPRLPQPKNAPREWVFWTEEINKLAMELKEERLALDERKRELDQFESRLISEREELRKVRSEIDAVRREVTDNIPAVKAAEKQNVKTLAKTYSAMKAQDAVAVLRELDDGTIVKILSVMKADVVGALFQEMSKATDRDGTLAVRAARLSDRLRLVRNDAKPAAQ